MTSGDRLLLDIDVGTAGIDLRRLAEVVIDGTLVTLSRAGGPLRTKDYEAPFDRFCNELQK